MQVTRLGAMWPYKISGDDPLVRLTARTGEAVYGQPSLLMPLSGGSSPMYAFGGPLGIAHAPNEHVRLSDFLNAARQIARILDGFADL